MDADEDREALRRRLYRPGASEEDRRRYVGTLQVAEPQPGPAPEPPRRPSRRRGVVAAALVGVVAVAVAVLVGRAAVGTAVASPPPAPTASSILPTQRVAASVDGLATTGLRVEGNGSAEVALDVSDASFGGGRMSVLLSSSDGRPVGWTARSLETRRDWTSYHAVVVSSPTRNRLDALQPEVVRYAGAPPRWIDVQAPANAVWTLTVAFTGDSDAPLR